MNVGWPNYVRGLLSEEQQRTVERVNKEAFAWDVRVPRLLAVIDRCDADLLSLVECDHYEVRQHASGRASGACEWGYQDGAARRAA